MKAAKALKEKGETPEELLQSIKENEKAVAEAEKEVDAWKAIAGEKARREEASKAEAERIATEKAEAEREAAEERERAEKEEKARIEAEKIAAEKAEEEARVEAERKAEEERIAKQKTEEAESDKEEAEKRMDDEEPKPVGSGVFGNIYNQFKGKVKEAFDFLMKHKGGDLLGVFHRKDVGDIDLVWGDENGGLAHILHKHVGEGKSFANVGEAMSHIQNIIETGKNDFEDGDKIVFRKGSELVTVRKNFREGGKKIADKNWVLTAYDKEAADNGNRVTTKVIEGKATPHTASTGKGSEKPEKKQKKQSVFDKAKEIADKEEKKRKAEAEKQKVDKQGNPIDAEGRLITEKVEDISDLSDDDFNNPKRSVELPKIPKNIDNALGANGKPVIIKKNIFERNKNAHSDLTAEQSREILKTALYSADLYAKNQKSKRPFNWVIIKTKDHDGKNKLVLLEVNDNKDNVEIVHWHYLDDRGLEKIKKQAEREGGQLLILPSEKEEAGALSSRTSDLPADKGSEVGGEKQEAEKKRPAPIAERIEDVGEKIGDARKDVWKEIIARIKNKKQGIEEALKKSSAGKLFSSLFDEKELLESGVSNEVVTFISAVKGSLGTKPRSLPKLKMWINKVLHQYDMCEQALENWESVKKKIDEWKYYSQPFYMYRAAMAVGGYESGRDVGNAELWQIADGYSDGKSVAGQWCVRKAGAYDGIYKTYEEAAEALKKFAGENAAVDGKGKRKEVKLAIYKRRTDGTMFIAPEGKPDVIIQDGFKTLYEASAYKKEHYAEMQERYRTLMDGIKPKFNENRERKGRDWRGGKDVSAEDFREAFDFRGVEFGNWMQQKDRRQALNECYDSLMDLAMVCGVSPKALSLGGKLAMAFGARGGGKFNAHYEPDKVVINLTKTKGAGSLAHEWFHAIDNYFNMQGWDEFATESTRNVERKEMAEAWKDLVRAINGSDYFKRSDKYARLKGSRYWIEPTELGARAFAVWVENRLSKYGTINDYLANNPRLVDEKASDAEKKYAPYPFDKDADWMDEKFGRLFEVMQERVDEETGKHILYSRNKAAGHENTELTAEERELRDNLVERMRKGGLDVVTDSEEMQRVIDTENERTRNKRSKKSEAARKRDEALYAVDWSTAFVSGKSREEATEIRRERGRKFKEETKELYGRVLSGNFDDVTLRLIDEFIDKSTPNNPYERPISKRLPTRALQKMRGGERTGSIDALFSRISESAVGKDGKALPRAERERAIEEKKKELLKKWAIATGNWHTDIADFTDQRESIGSGTDSDVYLGKDGKSVIKVSKGKPYGKRFRPDVDNVALFNTVFPGSRYTIEGYGEIDGKFVRFLKQPIVDFTSSTPLTEGERVAYMEKLGFKPINKENTAFSNGEIIASDLQKSNIVKDKQGNVRVIDADMKLHTKDVGGNYSYPDVEADTTGLAERKEVNTGSVREHRVYHGSGADFDAFDHSHMGEGEGAQAYGWGTYVTEVEGIGRTYAVQNSKYAREYPVYNGDSHGLSEGRINEILEVFLDGVSDETYILRAWDDAMQWYSSRKDDDYAQSLVRDASLLNPSDISIAGSKTRNLYTVEIPDDNGSNYLDWDAPVPKGTIPRINEYLREKYGEDETVSARTCKGLYHQLERILGGDKKASQALAELGYTGIKYPADYRRGGRKDGAKNYVIFNENDAKITDHTRFLRTAGGDVYGLVKDGRIYLDPKVATSETAVHEYTHLWGDMLRRKDSEQWSRTVKELKNSVLWEEVKELYPELKTDDEIADEVLSTFSGRRGAERLREEARRVADGEGGVFTKAKAIETLERVKEAIARFWEGVARMFGINRYRSAEELADMAMRDLLDSKNPMKDESGMRKRGEVGETLATSGTYFSGGGLLEAGLKGVIDPKVAVEFSEKIAGVYADNHGNHIVVADVRDVDPKKLVGAVDGGEVQYFHASPVCKNFSKAKREGGEVELDKETALSTAEFIAKTRPKVVTIENVKGYRNSEALKIITDELTRQGYDWDADVYNTADYGGYTKRERLIVRAKRDGKLPPKPEKLPEELRKKGWYSAVEDLIPHLEEKKTGVPQGTDERLKNSGIDYRTIDKPLYVFGRGYANKTVGHAFADELLPTLTTGGGDIIIMPDGRVLKASPRVLARVTGLPDTYKMPETDQLSHTIVGNGIPTQLTEGVIAPLLDNAIPSAERATKRESVFDVADRVSQNLEERTRAMGSRVEKRMADVAQKLEGKELSMEQKAVVDVFSGKSDNQKFSVKREDGKKQTYLLKQGNEEKAGAKHSLYRHYGTNSGVITADDVLKIPQVLERGERTEKAKGGKKMAVYTMDVDGAKFTVYTRIGKDYETIDDFYSNKKGSERYVLRNTDGVNNTPEGAHNPDPEPSAKVEDKSESPKLFGEEIIDDGKKGSDSIDRSVRENPKNEDKPRLSRKPGESIFDYASRVSDSVDRSVS